MNKYLLHGHFDDNISKIIDKARKSIYKKYKNEYSEKHFGYGYPHLTIIYGPKLFIENINQKNDDKNIIDQKSYDKNIIDQFYPKFLDKFNKLPSDIEFIDVTVFFGLDCVVIKAEFESKELNKMRKFLIESNPEIKKYYEDFKNNKKNIEKQLKQMFPNIYTKDKSYNKIPKGWIHSTLAVVKSDIGEDKILEIINYAKKIFNIIKDNKLKLKEIGLNLHGNFTKFINF